MITDAILDQIRTAAPPEFRFPPPVFTEMGAEWIEPGCGACINAGPGVTKGADQVSVSSQNRNFPGRSGPGQLYLVSPYSVAASAVCGYVTKWEPGKRFDPLPARRLTTV